MKVIRPGEHTTNPTIFLAGPIQSAPAWHNDAIEFLIHFSNNNAAYDIASPKLLEKPKLFLYDAQVSWETKYLKHSADTGVILFWLANPIIDELDPTRSYAQTTRFELAEWYGKSCYDKNIKLVVGIEPGFHGERYIKYRMSNTMPIYDNLKNVCEHTWSYLNT